jgi:hypothetical protein
MSEPGAESVSAELLDRDGKPLPPLPADATPEQKDQHWMQARLPGRQDAPAHRPRGLMGGVWACSWRRRTSTPRSPSAGPSASPSPPASCPSSSGTHPGVHAGLLVQMSVLENNCMQSTASAAGYSTGSTLATMFGALLLLADSPMARPPRTSRAGTSSPSGSSCSSRSAPVSWASSSLPHQASDDQLTSSCDSPRASPRRKRCAASTAASKDAVHAPTCSWSACSSALVTGILNTGEGTLPRPFRRVLEVKTVGFACRIPEMPARRGFWSCRASNSTPSSSSPACS